MRACEWCGRAGCRDHQSERAFALGKPTFESLGPRPVNDYGYVRRREALIPAAEELARSAVGPPPKCRRDRREWDDRWSRAFHAAMEYLWREFSSVSRVP